ncbi:MAG: phosphatase PAP2 family protein [Bacteroidota bacterium]
MLEKLLKWDRDTFIYLNGLGTESYDAFWSTITEITTWIPLFLLFAVLFFIKFSGRTAFFQVLGMIALAGFITLATHLTKIWLKRPRPCNEDAINSFIRILKTPTDYSFFSGHASSSFALATMAYLLLRKRANWVWAFFLWPSLFAYSRIYVGVHYPLDIIVGAAVGSLSGILFYRFYLATAPDIG